MNLEQEQEAIYVAIKLSREAVERLIDRSPNALKQQLEEVLVAIDHVILLLGRAD